MSDYSSNFPTQSPTFAFDAKAGKLDSRLSYSRSSGGTYLSNEKALNSENLLLQSQDFDTSWTTSGISAPTGSQTAPDGTATAWLLSCDSGVDKAPRILQSFSATANTEYTIVGHLKAGTASHGYVVFRVDTNNQYAAAMLDFSAGTISVTSAGVSNASGTVTALGSNWFRVTVTATSVASVGSPFAQIGISDGTAIGQYGRAVWSPAGTETMYAWGVQLSTVGSKVYDSPTTTQIHREYSPLLKTASADSPRFEFASDGQSVGTALGLLVESQSTNYNTKSEDIAGWSTPSNMTVSASAMVAPNGTLTADVLTVSDDTVASGHFAYRASSDGTSGQTVAASFFAKTAGVNHIYFYDANTANAGADSVSIFDLNNGTIGGTNAPNCKMIDCGNGWWRCVSVYTLTGAGTSLRFYTTDNGSTTTYIGNGFDGFGLWGVQVEIGVSSESSYISTSGSTVSRASDSCSVVDATLFSSGEHTIIWEGDTDYAPNDKRFFALSDGSMNNRFVADYDNGVATRLRNWADDVNNVGMSTSTVDMTVGTHKLAATLKTNEAQLVIDGTRRQVDTFCVVGGGIDQLAINSTTTGAGPTFNMNGHCKRITYYNVALSQTEAEALTSNP